MPVPAPEMPTEAVQTNNAFVGRQCIFDERLGVFAYELLYRDGDVGCANVVDSAAASSAVMLAGFIDIGLQRLVGEYPAFINFPRELLLRGRDLPVGSDRVVLEVLEDVRVDTALIEAVTELHARGYAIALDDFVYAPHWKPLIEVADYIKVDVLALGLEGAREQRGLLANFSGKLLAEKVETAEELDTLKSMGFEYFQGFFLAKPQVVRGQRVGSARLATLQLVAALQRPEADAAEIERIIVRDAPLSFKLLRYVNSALYALPREVTSIHKVIVLLGLDALKRIATLIALSKVEDKPPELVHMALLRARMCELLGSHANGEDPGTYFMVGLLSALDALLDAPLASLLETLPLSEDVNRALLEHQGPLGRALGCTLAYERCEWEKVSWAGLTPQALGDTYAEAIAWSEQTAAGVAA